MYYEPKPITDDEVQQEKTEYVAVHQENIDKLQGTATAKTIQEVPICKVGFLEWLLGNDIVNWKSMIRIAWSSFLACFLLWIGSMASCQFQRNKLEKEAKDESDYQKHRAETYQDALRETKAKLEVLSGK